MIQSSRPFQGHNKIGKTCLHYRKRGVLRLKRSKGLFERRTEFRGGCNGSMLPKYFQNGRIEAVDIVEGVRGCWVRSCRHAKNKLSLESAHWIQAALEEHLLRSETRISVPHLRMGFVRSRSNESSPFSIDQAASEPLPSAIRNHNMSLEEATQLVHGEDTVDSRPNKGLDPNRL
ncbi:unnamed protein product [Phytophthora fragariaefolia]|uniref:Unnamed protein product n=1 Tax=Phytophthora fragariaefolia TaxID=1490495 RepID=A0A9W6TUE0_9STRA|nr:unnamed protein product [Phytophthora fragariaefolia]